jgi:SAM-dependent methyltransferase
MQNQENTNFSGLEELRNIEKFLPKYNQYIVDLCAQYISPHSQVMDFGAGMGTLSMLLKKKFGCPIITVEIDSSNVAILEDLGFKNFKNIEEIDYKFDLIFSSNVLEHIENDVQTVQKLRDKIKPGGYLYLYLPAHKILWTKMDEIVGHYRRYSRSGILGMLSAGGLKVVRCHYADSLGFLATLLTKLIGYNHKSGIGSGKSLKFYNDFVFPASRLIDKIGFKYLVGKNLVITAQRL